MSLVVRPARDDELEEAGRLLVAAYRAGGFLTEEDRYAGVLADTRGRAQDAEILVALAGGRLVGTVTYCPEGSTWCEVAADGEGEFRMLGVAPGGQGRGVGRALVEACLGRAREVGRHSVVLCSLPEMTAAHRLYERMGFERVPDLDWSPVPGVDLWGFRIRL